MVMSDSQPCLELQQSGSGERGGGGKKGEGKGEKKKYEPPVPTRVGKRRKRTKGPDTASKLPAVTPHTKCKLKVGLYYSRRIGYSPHRRYPQNR